MRPLLYAGLVGLASSLIGFSACLSLGFVLPDGEAWVGWAVAWIVVALPVTLLGSGLSALAFRRFHRLASHLARAVAFAANSVVVALLGYLPVLLSVALDG